MVDKESWGKSVKKIRELSKECYKLYFGDLL